MAQRICNLQFLVPKSEGSDFLADELNPRKEIDWVTRLREQRDAFLNELKSKEKDIRIKDLRKHRYNKIFQQILEIGISTPHQAGSFSLV
jgi:hypothetical protein